MSWLVERWELVQTIVDLLPENLDRIYRIFQDWLKRDSLLFHVILKNPVNPV
jgi:hypothetical protein